MDTIPQLNIYVGNRLRERRKQLKLSQEELAKHLGISYQQVQKYESGQTQLTLTRLFQIAETLNAPPAYFIEGAPTHPFGEKRGSDEFVVAGSKDCFRILLVEDNSADELLFRRAVSNLSHNIEITGISSPEKVMDYIANCEAKYGHPIPDIIILDINMPKLDGFEILRRLKNNQACCHIPVIMLTNSIRTADMERSYRLQASSFIQKPAQFEEYAQTVSAMVDYWAKTAVLPSIH